MSGERLFNAGFDSLIPVIPPGASLAPTSKLSPAMLGKSPGIRLASGMWCGTNWRAIKATAEDVQKWMSWKANIGLKADRFPGLDIDVADAGLAQMIEQAALTQLGQTPVRIGSPPKRLLPYRLAGEPFSKMKLILKRDDKQYLVEWLATGQQYLVAGTHPTGRAYSWSTDPDDASALPEITREKASAFLDYLNEMLSMLGYEGIRIGDGAPAASRAADQPGLVAPSIGDLREAVSMIPNPDTNRWDDFIRMLCAVKAAAGHDDEDGFEIFAEWASRWEDTAVGEDPRSLWRRTRGPFSIGWGWISDKARGYGYNDSPFPAVEETAPTPAEAGTSAPFLSEQWLAMKVVESCHPILRYVPASDQWLVWNQGRWQPDAEMLAVDTVKLELRKIAHKVGQMGASEKEKREAENEAKSICSAWKVEAVAKLVKMDRAIAISPESLDFNQWVINTPEGIVDLKTGKMGDPDPDQLCTRSTAVAPAFGAAKPEFDRFLNEATGGDKELQAYLKRLCGYALTGSTKEQKYVFIYGLGGNGKGTFLKVLMQILHHYHKNAAMETFTASNNDRHPTELAMLAGARLVTASETAPGKRWDEPKLKRMTGGDPITAHFMRQDDFTFIPQFKLVFIGNNKPEIRNLDEAMKRRTHLVPFVVKPKVVDGDLDEKLKREFPAILAWFIEGCLEWQQVGLKAPASVQAATEEYFDETDPVGQWLEQCTARTDVGEWVDLLTLFDSWREWNGRQGEQYNGKIQRLGQMLTARHYPKRKHPTNRRLQFAGIKVIPQALPMEAVQ